MGKFVNSALALIGIALFVRAGFGGWLDAWLLVVMDDPERSGGARVLAGLAAFVAGVYGLIDTERSARAERLRRRNTELELEVIAPDRRTGTRQQGSRNKSPAGRRRRSRGLALTGPFPLHPRSRHSTIICIP